MRGPLQVLAGVVAGVVAVLAVAAIVVGSRGTDRGADGATEPAPELSFPAVDHDPDAARSLVVAWDRWRRATFVSVGRWTRTLDGNPTPLTGEVRTVQDPPRRLVVRLGTVVESIGGDEVVCEAPSDELIVPDCAAVATGRSFDDRLRAEMSLVLGYVLDDVRLYDVAVVDDPAGGGDECFALALRAALLRAPWGRAARFCFDDATGVLTSSRVRRQAAVDEEVTTEIRTEVTAADFDR